MSPSTRRATEVRNRIRRRDSQSAAPRQPTRRQRYAAMRVSTRIGDRATLTGARRMSHPRAAP